jgi:hypothetical protein
MRFIRDLIEFFLIVGAVCLPWFFVLLFITAASIWIEGVCR